MSEVENETSVIEVTEAKPKPAKKTSPKRSADTPVLVAVEAEPVAPPATPVAAQKPSSSVVHEVVTEVETSALLVEDAVRNLVAFVKDGRRAGDSDVEVALANVQAALAAQK